MRREDFTHQTFLAAMREMLKREPLPPPRVVYALPDDRYKAPGATILPFRPRTYTWSDPDAQ